MKGIERYINEGIYLNNEQIDVNEKGRFGFMIYDPNSGTVFVFGVDRPQDLIDEYEYDDAEAWKLVKLNVGQTYCDNSSAINTRIW